MNTNQGHELNWDDDIDINADVFRVLEEGEYDFVVKSHEKSRYQPQAGAKLPPCNMVTLHLDVDNTTIEHRLFLHSRCEGMLCAFFKAIGARTSGERLKMEWNRVNGATGRCVIGIRKWIGKDGTERESNEVKRFIEPTAGETIQAAPEATTASPAPTGPTTWSAAATDLPF